MADDITIPKVGTVPKKVLIPIGVGAAAFIGWRYWKARNDVAAADPVTDGDFGAVDSSIPGVLNPFPSTGGTSDAGNDTDTELGPGRFTNNAQWSNYVIDKLLSGEWTYNEIASAIGLGLAGKPTNDAQQTILRAAVAVGGQPPQGTITIVSGGNTNLTVAPTNVRVASATTSTISLAWNPVSGADHYVIEYGSTRKTTSGLGYTVTGLSANTAYTFAVSGANGADVSGPVASVAGKTTAVQPGGYRGYGWVKADGKKSIDQYAAAYYKVDLGYTKPEWTALFYKWNPGASRVPKKGMWLKDRENSNPLTGYTGK